MVDSAGRKGGKEGGGRGRRRVHTLGPELSRTTHAQCHSVVWCGVDHLLKLTPEGHMRFVCVVLHQAKVALIQYHCAGGMS